MYLTDFRENTLQDVITRLEPDLFLTITGLTKDFHLLVQLKVAYDNDSFILGSQGPKPLSRATLRRVNLYHETQLIFPVWYLD